MRIAGLIIAALTACACQYDPYTSSYATSKPNRQDVFGHWTATDATLAELSRGAYRKARPTIDVSEDGSIHMSDVPDTWRADFGEGAGKLETFVGTWQLRKHQDRWWGLELRRGDWGCVGCLMVLGDKEPRTLVIRFGDPDEGRGYEFNKASSLGAAHDGDAGP